MRDAADCCRTGLPTDEATGRHRALCPRHTDAPPHAAARGRLPRAGNRGESRRANTSAEIAYGGLATTRNGRFGNRSREASARTTVTASSRKHRRSSAEPSRMQLNGNHLGARCHQMPGQCAVACPDVEDEITGYDA